MLVNRRSRAAARRAHARRRRVRFVVLFALLVALLAAGLYVGAPWLHTQFYALYRYEYRGAIEENAALQGVDPLLAASVIHCESHFRPEAVSRVGARGLMQIMPETGEWIAGKFGEESSYTPDALFDPQTNIRYGCWYLGFLCRLFGSDRVAVIAAYHAGQNAVSSWLRDPAISPDGWTLPVEKIPYQDTQHYVNKVVKAYAIYQRLYGSPQAR